MRRVVMRCKDVERGVVFGKAQRARKRAAVQRVAGLEREEAETTAGGIGSAPARATEPARLAAAAPATAAR